MLVDQILLAKGVTTLTAPSGGGKTTLATTIAMTVGSTGPHPASWNGQPINQRPVILAAGEGEDDLRPIVEAWLLQNPNRSLPHGGFIPEAFDLSNPHDTDQLIKLAKSLNAPPLVILDALADHLGDSDDDKARDMNRVYRNVWRVVKATNAAILIPHHSGWDKERERGSTVIRAKSDIVVHITQFNPVTGLIQLRHNKRRGGAKLKNFAYAVELVRVSGFPEPVPLVIGTPPQSNTTNLDEDILRRSPNAQLALDILRARFPHGALRQEWLEEWQKDKGGPNAKGASEDVFDRAKDELLKAGDVASDGKSKGATYWVRATTQNGEIPTTKTPHQISSAGFSASAPSKGGAEEMRRISSANTPHCGANAENASKGGDFGNATKSHSGVPPEADPAEAERWRAMRDYEEQMFRERTAKATGAKPDDLAREAMEQIRKRKA